jgi:hypothetical protein
MAETIASSRRAADGGAADCKLLQVLRQIADAGGSIVPRLNPSAQNGYEFGALAADEHFLASLARRDYLDERFVDRVSLCPKCSSHHLNVREVCPACGKPNISDEVVLHHFRCGFVGRASEFVSSDEDRICPKCMRALRHIGTEYDRLGKTFRCNECGVMFQDPPVAAVCLSCGIHTPADELRTADVFSYALTSRGLAAIQHGRVRDVGSVPGGQLPFHNADVARAILEQEAKRAEYFAQPFAVLRLDRQSESNTISNEEPVAFARGLRNRLRDVDVIGMISESRMVVILMGTDRNEIARISATVRSHLGRWAVSAIEVCGTKDLSRVFD